VIRAALAAALAAGLVASSAASESARTPKYSLRDLGTLGGTVSAATDVNVWGQVVGASTTVDGYSHAFVWSSGKLTDLGTLGGQSSYAIAVNDSGAVVGYSELAGSARAHAFLWRRATGMRDLGTLGGSQSFAVDVNDAGRVVGRSFDASDTPRGFVWTAGTGMRPLLGDPFSVAGAVGASGVVGGSVGLPLVPGTWRTPSAPFQPFVLPSGFGTGETHSLNAYGDAVGTLSSPGGVRGFFHHGTTTRALRTIGGLYDQAEAYSISNARRIVGVAYRGQLENSGGWLARGPSARPQLLGDLAGRPGWSLASASAVNDLGQIAGTGSHEGQPRAFLLTPDRAERAGNLNAFAPGGRAFHARLRRTVARSLGQLAQKRKARACGMLKRLASSGSRERTLSAPVRSVFATDVRAVARGLGCR